MKCTQCGTEFEGRFCPECGAKAEAEAPVNPSQTQKQQSAQQQSASPVFNVKPAGKRAKKQKKPIYKRWWFILGVIIFALGMVASLTGNRGERTSEKIGWPEFSLGTSDYLTGSTTGEESEKIDWSEIVLKNLLPEPPSKEGTLYENSDEELRVDLDRVTDSQYNAYRNDCINMGFTVDADKASDSYEAYNADGYFLEITHYSDGLDLTVNAPMELDTITWPTGTAGKLLPAPKSTTGKFNYEYDNSFSVYIGNTSKADYDEYVAACCDKGFTVDYDKDKRYYRANNAERYHLSLSYEGNNVMRIQIDEPKEEEKETETSQAEKKTSKKESSKPAKTPDNANESAAGADTLRTDFKEAMDSYETFVDEYCEFIIKYRDNPGDAGLLADYAAYMEKDAEFTEKIDKWENEDMNDAEWTYYWKVMTKVSQKLQKALQ